MARVILIYASCVNPKALGDFAFAGSIARDLARELKDAHTDIQVVLMTTEHEIDRFTCLYGKPNPDAQLYIDGQTIGLCSLETFDPTSHTVVAYIGANPCQAPSSDLIKNLLSSDTQCLFVLAANHPTSENYKKIILTTLQAQYNTFLHYFDDQFLIAPSGLSEDQLGLQRLPRALDLPPLSMVQQSLLPTIDYGFMYVAALKNPKEYKLMAQAMKLMDVDQVVLVGNYVGLEKEIHAAYVEEETLKRETTLSPTITCYTSLEYNVMRQIGARSQPKLTLTTGICSTLELMWDSKVTYVQDLPCNKAFIFSYLIALKAVVRNDTSLIIELSELLFAPKPLLPKQLQRAQILLKTPEIVEGLIVVNKTVLEKANGRLAPQLLSFIDRSRPASDRARLLNRVQLGLKKDTESHHPNIEVSLRRAAAKGCIFELKVLLSHLSEAGIPIDTTDEKYHRSALLWASYYQKFSCMKLLLDHKARVNLQDISDRTPLHYVMSYGNKELIQLLLNAGATIDIMDASRQSPIECATPEVQLFVRTNYPHLQVKHRTSHDEPEERRVRARLR